MNTPGNADLPIGPLQPVANQELATPAEANQEIGVPGLPGIPRGWHSRGYLPHFDSTEATQHVTFHLADSLPTEVVQRLAEEVKTLPADQQDVQRRIRVEAWLDAGHGSCVLREPSIGDMVEGALLFFDAQRYRLLAWVVMPNHVHVLFQPMNGWAVAKIVASWKKFTATKICAFRRKQDATREIGSSAPPVWHRDYWDRYMRDNHHFEQAMEYIHQNPVRAGLVARAQDWPWSSARLNSTT